MKNVLGKVIAFVYLKQENVTQKKNSKKNREKHRIFLKMRTIFMKYENKIGTFSNNFLTFFFFIKIFLTHS